MDKLEIMREKADLLNEAGKAYYQESREIMSNAEYDKLYDELTALEAETGVTLGGSPTVTVGYEVLDNLPKEAHQSKMLSLDKTKDREALAEWLGAQTGMLSLKLDGLTIVLTYEGGRMVKAVTRGNGEIGEVITGNAKTFCNVPASIPYKGRLVLRGEALIKYSDFEKINQEMGDADAKYKNPRNLCSGSVRQLNSRITANRRVHFYGFGLVSIDGNVESTEAGGDATEAVAAAREPSEPMMVIGAKERPGGIENGNSRIEQLEWLKSQGFDIVEYKKVINREKLCSDREQDTAEQNILMPNRAEQDILMQNRAVQEILIQDTAEDLKEAVSIFEDKVSRSDLPSDGLVLIYDDIAYGKSLGSTAKFPRDAIAFKWRDEVKETRLLEIEWSASRTGLINPIAVFEPVELEGTSVSRASVHNVSIMKDLELGAGDRIEVYKANMIIPQIRDNLTRSGAAEIPEKCPVCGGRTEIRSETGVETLCCVNSKCLAKQIKSFTHFVSRDAMNIEGLSSATIEKLIAKGLIKELADLFKLASAKEVITEMEGLGEKSFQNLIASAEKAKKTTPARLLYSLGIPGIGVANAKLICRAYGNDWMKIQKAEMEDLTAIDGVGDVMAESYETFFADEDKRHLVEDILAEIELQAPALPEGKQSLEGKTFVITGSLTRFENRDGLKSLVEAKGGKVAGSVSSKTHYLINNDNLSGSTKNKSAKKLGIPIITEEGFLKLLGEAEEFFE